MRPATATFLKFYLMFDPQILIKNMLMKFLLTVKVHMVGKLVFIVSTGDINQTYSQLIEQLDMEYQSKKG